MKIYDAEEKNKNVKVSKMCAYITGSIALGVGMYLVMPKVIDKLTNFMYKLQKDTKLDEVDDDCEPIIVKKGEDK